MEVETIRFPGDVTNTFSHTPGGKKYKFPGRGHIYGPAGTWGTVKFETTRNGHSMPQNAGNALQRMQPNSFMFKRPQQGISGAEAGLLPVGGSVMRVVGTQSGDVYSYDVTETQAAQPNAENIAIDTSTNYATPPLTTPNQMTSPYLSPTASEDSLTQDPNPTSRRTILPGDQSNQTTQTNASITDQSTSYQNQMAAMQAMQQTDPQQYHQMVQTDPNQNQQGTQTYSAHTIVEQLRPYLRPNERTLAPSTPSTSLAPILPLSLPTVVTGPIGLPTSLTNFGTAAINATMNGMGSGLNTMVNSLGAAASAAGSVAPSIAYGTGKVLGAAASAAGNAVKGAAKYVSSKSKGKGKARSRRNSGGEGSSRGPMRELNRTEKFQQALEAAKKNTSSSKQRRNSADKKGNWNDPDTSRHFHGMRLSPNEKMTLAKLKMRRMS